jgi:hypothetical protein
MARAKTRKWSNLKGSEIDDSNAIELTPRQTKVLTEVDKRRVKEDSGDPVTIKDLEQEWSTLEEEEGFEDQGREDRSILFAALEKRVLEELERIKDQTGIDMYRGEQVTFSPKFVLNSSVENPQVFYAWVKKKVLEHMLTMPVGRLKSIVATAMDTDLAAAMTPAQRAALEPGEPGSGVPPPGVRVTLHTTINHTSQRTRRRPAPDADDDGPF